jgi:hypothetical protein
MTASTGRRPAQDSGCTWRAPAAQFQWSVFHRASFDAILSLQAAELKSFPSHNKVEVVVEVKNMSASGGGEIKLGEVDLAAALASPWSAPKMETVDSTFYVGDMAFLVLQHQPCEPVQQPTTRRRKPGSFVEPLPTAESNGRRSFLDPAVTAQRTGKRGHGPLPSRGKRGKPLPGKGARSTGPPRRPTLRPVSSLSFEQTTATRTSEVIKFHLLEPTALVRVGGPTAGISLRCKRTVLTLLDDPKAILDVVEHWMKLAEAAVALNLQPRGKQLGTQLLKASRKVPVTRARSLGSSRIVCATLRLQETCVKLEASPEQYMEYHVPELRAHACGRSDHEAMWDVQMSATEQELISSQGRSEKDELRLRVPALTAAYKAVTRSSWSEPDAGSTSSPPTEAAAPLGSPTLIRHHFLVVKAKPLKVVLNVNSLNHLASLSELYAYKLQHVLEALKEAHAPRARGDSARLLNSFGERRMLKEATAEGPDGVAAAAPALPPAPQSLWRCELHLAGANLATEGLFGAGLFSLESTCIDMVAAHDAPLVVNANLRPGCSFSDLASVILQAEDAFAACGATVAHFQTTVTVRLEHGHKGGSLAEPTQGSAIFSVEKPILYFPPHLIKALVKASVDAKQSMVAFQARTRAAGARLGAAVPQRLPATEQASSWLANNFVVSVQISNLSLRVPLNIQPDALEKEDAIFLVCTCLCSIVAELPV